MMASRDNLSPFTSISLPGADSVNLTARFIADHNPDGFA
jgi:hypothetical protein